MCAFFTESEMKYSHKIDLTTKVILRFGYQPFTQRISTAIKKKKISLQNCIFENIKDMTLNPGRFTNFSVPFPVESTNICYWAFKIPG